MGLVKKNCKEEVKQELNCLEEEHKLYISQNEGKSWEFKLDYVSYANWDKHSTSFVPTNRIFATHRSVVQKNEHNSILTYSDDYYKS